MATGQSEDSKKLTGADCLIAALIFLAIIIEGLHTMRMIGPSWDEPVYFHLANSYLGWLKNLGAASLSADALERVFGISVQNYSTAFTHFLGAFTMVAFRDLLGEFRAYRIYALILFGLLMALVYLRAKLSWGRSAAAASVLFVLFMPRLFSEGHIGATESPLCFFWFLTVVVFEAAFKKKYFAPLAGVCFGLAMSVKFTGFLLAAPLLAWGLVYRPKKILFPTLCLFLLGPLVFVLLQPSCWHHPVDGLVNFITLSVSREQYTGYVPVVFLGKYYKFSAPWFYAPFMVLVTVPVFGLLMFALGFFRLVANRFKDSLALAAAIHFLFFMVLVMSPNAPTYDGVRLFIPALVFLGLIAGYGFDGARVFLARKLERLGFLERQSGKTLALLILAVILSVVFLKNYPFGLEYYNGLIGGAKGARARGMETTYWWTVVNEDALSEINAKLPADSLLLCWPTRARICEFYQELGLLKKEVKITYQTDFDYLLMLSRPYWDYQPFFDSIGVDRRELTVEAESTLDGVPLWVLYKRAPETIDPRK